MPKAGNSSFYAVRAGRQPGIYYNWNDCEAQIKGYQGARYKKFGSTEEAQAYVDGQEMVSPPRTRASTRAAAAATSSALVVENPAGPSATQYKREPANKEEEDDESGADVVYCDGACRGNGQKGSLAGLGVWWGYDDPRNLSERCPGAQTNNRAELCAIVRVLETTTASKGTLIIKTDSSYSIKCFQSWIPKWRTNGFRTSNGQPVKNEPLIKYLAALLAHHANSGHKIVLKHVKGHAGIPGNEGADRLAVAGATFPELEERNWEKDENEIATKMRVEIPADLDEYADCLLDDEEAANYDETPTREVPTDSSPPLTKIVVKEAPQPPETKRPLVDSPGKNPSRPSDSRFSTSPSRQVTRKPLSSSSASPRKPGPPETMQTRSFVSPTKSENSSSRRVEFAPKPRSRASATPSSRPTGAAKNAPLTENELNEYAEGLLSDDELLSLGKDGNFDSDF